MYMNYNKIRIKTRHDLYTVNGKWSVQSKAESKNPDKMEQLEKHVVWLHWRVFDQWWRFS